MAANIPLMAYLQKTMPHIPINFHGQSRANTTNQNYRATDITNLQIWQNFNLATILNSYGNLLTNAMIRDHPNPPTPPAPSSSESTIRARLNTYVCNHVKRALRCGFWNLSQIPNGMAHRTATELDEGREARIINGYVPDYAYAAIQAPPSTRPNRLPGDCKPSYKWEWNLWNSQDATEQLEFRQALSQVNFYMNQHHTRYGFIVTDRELVAIKKMNNNGHLLLSRPILIAQQGNVHQPRLTSLLALWYLGMLASVNAGPDRWNMS